MKLWQMAVVLTLGATGSAVTQGMVAAGGSGQSVPTLTQEELPGLVTMYKKLHAAPELSHQEVKTSALLAAQLRQFGYKVTEDVGKYPDGTQAHGVVAVLENGPGPRLLIRADMDALPVEEKTGLPYASHVKGKTATGQDVGVMHACGHDVHVTTMVGVAKNLAALKNEWHGTVMLVGQPSEETIDGAKAMLDDGLYKRFGRPDMAIALHDANFPAGTVSVVPGYALASSTGVDVAMRGIGSHGSQPEAGKDPIVMSAEFITELQTIVSRSTPPQKAAVLTVGEIHGGTKRNIIPDEVKMELNFRAYDEGVRQTILQGIERTAKGVGIAAGVPENRMPVVTMLEYTPATYNDPALSGRLTELFRKKLGEKDVIEKPPIMGSEDFGLFSDGGKIPSVIFWLGAYDPALVAKSVATGVALPSPHSALFAPLPEPALKTGIIAMTDAALELLR